MLVTYTIVLAFISWKMCIVIICSLGIILFIPRLVGNKFETMNNSLSTSKANYLSKCEELFLAHDLINNKNIDAIEEQYNVLLKKMQHDNYELEKYKSFVQIFSGSALYLQLIFCFIAGVLFTYIGVISVGLLASCLIYVEYVSRYASNIVDEFIEIKSANSYIELFSEFAMYVDEREQESTKIDFASLEIKKLNYCVENQTIIKDCNLKIVRNQKVLIIGKNGAGKTTFLKILAGFILPDSGQILFNENVSYNYSDVCYVPQTRYIFEGSILNNITMFGENVDNIEKNKIDNICRKINLKKELDYEVFNKGTNLSGGEIAKICLIRSLYDNANLMLVDEPLNDIDKESEHDILNCLLDSDKTVVMIAHGKMPYEKFDKVIEIDNGIVRNVRG